MKFAVALTGLASASQLVNVDNDDATVAPVALLHGVTDSCPQTNFTDKISAAIGNAAVVKCVEIGDGANTSVFERIKW